MRLGVVMLFGPLQWSNVCARRRVDSGGQFYMSKPTIPLEVLRKQAANLTVLIGRTVAIELTGEGVRAKLDGNVVTTSMPMVNLDQWLAGFRKGLGNTPTKPVENDVFALVQRMSGCDQARRLEIIHTLIEAFCPGCGSDKGPKCECMQ